MLREGVTVFTTTRLGFATSKRSSKSLFGGRILSRLFSTQQRAPGAFKYISDLLTGHEAESPQKEKHSDSPQKTSSDQQPGGSRVQYIPKFIAYEYETPKRRWLDRHILGGRSITRDSSSKHASVAFGQERIASTPEPLFIKSDRSCLLPPYHEAFRRYRDFDYTRAKNMKCHVQVLTTPTADTQGTTLLLHFDNKRYLLGSLGEGTQRAAIQVGARLLKVTECFVTGKAEWENLGGMMGMILTLADAAGSSRASAVEEARKNANREATRKGVPSDSDEMRALEEKAMQEVVRNSVTFFAPPNTEHTLATARRFVFRKGMPVNVHEFKGGRKFNAEDEDEWAPYWADSNIKVWPMAIMPSSSTTTARPEPRSVSPRKRGIEEVYADEPAAQEPTPAASNGLTQDESNELTAKAVVGEMFNSSWRLDTLYPTRLADVAMPAVIFRRNPSTNKLEKYIGPKPGGNVPLPDPDLEVLVRRPWPGALVQNLPPTKPAPEAISYIVRNHKQRGKFNPKNAMALKVPKGQLWSKLAAGESVQNEDGETITPDQVLGESKEGGGFAVVHLPDPSYIDNLVARPEWREPKVSSGVGAIVWICGAGVAMDPSVRKFMQDFDRFEHIVSSPDYSPNGYALDSAAASTIRLSKVDDKRYRIPVHGNDKAARNHIDHPLPKNARHIARGQILQVEPKMEVHERQVIPSLDIPATEVEVSQEILDEAANARKTIKTNSAEMSDWAKGLPEPNVEITTLGTGSALPSKYRNVSATLVRVPGWGNLLFDCGENTLGQLKRVYPPQELEKIIRELRMIFISHMHADHHLGTVGVIKAWYNVVHNAQPAPLPAQDAEVASLFEGQNRLVVLGEPTMQQWLQEYAAVEDYGYSRLAPLVTTFANPAKGFTSNLSWFVPPAELAKLTRTDRQAELDANMMEPSLIGLSDVQTVQVQHCHGARAVSLTWPSGFKASYSGDCRPSKNFVDIGKDSTVCIHEATFDDELQGDAEAKNHSTTSEALSVAQGMGAKACVLTHFSQRYQKLPVLEHGSSDAGEGAAVTQDLPMLNGDDVEAEETSPNPDDNLSNPLEDAAAMTTYKPFSANTNQQVDLADQSTRALAADHKPTAVRFKLQSDMKVCVAFDYMRVRLGDVAELQHYTPALLKLFAEVEEGESEGEGAADAAQEDTSGKKLKKGKMSKKEKKKSGEM